MEGHSDDGLRDLFSQPDPVFPAGGYDFFSQAESSCPGPSAARAPRTGMHALDLNSQAEDFPNLTAYSEMLLGDGVARGRGSRTLGLRAPRNARGGVGRVVRGGGRARSLSFGGRRGGSMAEVAASGGGRGGSMAEGAASGGGRGGSSRGRRGRRGTTTAADAEAVGEDNFNVDDEENAEDAADELVILQGSQIKCDKAQWSEQNTYAFCDLCVEQIRAGNCHKGIMSGRGYKTIAEKYFLKTGLKHDRRQLRNRIHQLKTLYGFWGFLQKQSGLGRHPNGTVLAPAWWWEQHTQGKSECKKLKDGPPEYLDQLEEMFHDVVVDGSTSYIPGQEGEEEEPEDAEPAQEGNYDDLDHSPMSTSSRKRSCSTSTKDNATSPGKKSKSPMVRMMRELVTKWSASEDATIQVLQKAVTEKGQKRNKLADSVKRCQDLALECGATPDSVEYFACATIFEKEFNREFFCNIPTPEGRMIFLKRWCQSHNMY